MKLAREARLVFIYVFVIIVLCGELTLDRFRHAEGIRTEFNLINVNGDSATLELAQDITIVVVNVLVVTV